MGPLAAKIKALEERCLALETSCSWFERKILELEKRNAP